MSLVRVQILSNFGFLCTEKALLGSKGIVVKCAAAIFFPTVQLNPSVTWNPADSEPR